MADFSYEDFIGWGDPNAGDPWNSPMPADTPGWEDFTSWGDPTGPGSSGDTSFSGEGGGNWLQTVLGGLGSVGSFLGQNAGTLGPLLSGAGSLAGGAIGSNAANEAARLQSAALNRGIDLSTSQWLNQLERTQPWVQAGQQSLGTLQGLAGQQLPGLPGATPGVSGANYALPGTTPGWAPQAYQGPAAPNAGDFSWNPQQGPSAQSYRYTPGQTPDAAGYRWTPGQAPSAAQYQYRPGAVPTLSGKELLANDPGVQFRQDEARKALEGSAAARGDLLSGQNLKALQSRSQDLASQEYGNAFARASQQAQLREQWGQAASQMGFGQASEEARLREAWAQQASQQGFGQAEAASRLREQVNQIASQQGWSQAQAEAAFREQIAQQASQQGFGQALAGQGQQFTQGLQAQQWQQRQQQQYETDMYQRMLEQSKLRYSQDVAGNQTDYDRQQALYRQQLAQHLLPWEQNSTLAQIGAQVTGQLGNQGIASSSGISNLLGQLGSSQAMGTLGSAGQWNTALAGGIGGIQNVLRGLNA